MADSEARAGNMKPVDMTNFRGRRKAGVDYSRALRDWLPELIGTTPKSKREIAEATGRNFETVTRLFEKIRSEIHIAGWRRGEVGEPTALWLLGAGKDAARPAAKTSSEKSKKYRSTARGKAISRSASDRWKQSEAGRQYQQAYNQRRMERYYQKQAERQRAYAVLKSVDPLLAAIMGARK